jgi:predicted site-specific integrase-resolvase
LYVDLLTPEDAAKRLHVTTGTLAVWRSTGRYKIPFIKVGSKVMYRAIDLEQFLNDRMRTVA